MDERMMNQNGNNAIPSFNTNEGWAQFLRKSGFMVMPVVPGTKIPASKWQPWVENQSEGHIELHWRAHPAHDVCLIAGDKLYALDADREEARQQLLLLEETHGISPRVVVKTTHGCHHYFRLPEGVAAKQGSHHSDKHPERLDVKTGRSLLMGPGSLGKVIERWDIAHIDDLIPVTQAFVNDVARLNGEPPPSANTQPIVIETQAGGTDMAAAKRLVRTISPAGYDVWTKVGMALHTMSGGSADGLSLYNTWSACGKDYVGPAAIQRKWDSFRRGVARPCSLGTLKFLAKQNGADVAELLEPFERVDMEVVS
jgi:hypothetical protein